jgi:hypothetical protein
MPFIVALKLSDPVYNWNGRMSVRQHTYETERVTSQSLNEESISESAHRRFSFFGVTFFYAVVPLFHSSSDALMSHLQEANQ